MEVHCLSAILSEHDLERVGGASGRDGLRRTMPKFEKYERPGRVWAGSSDEVCEVSAGGRSQGVASSCAAIVSSILASPPKLISFLSGVKKYARAHKALLNNTCASSTHQPMQMAEKILPYAHLPPSGGQSLMYSDQNWPTRNTPQVGID